MIQHVAAFVLILTMESWFDSQ